ncbi:hypothetical protein B0J13DRAFT_621978 [Dactylonectria estremocensis]|uniref:Uncharacterized protein n=1 Tax=Dactylonectria estremocensis TaxID=1079267 RepID=A0A9P9EXH4_9HYPO|nr:hypothetical protein B0J13DRAFT_621978 [Dactylonectria estremocensis]
MVQFNRFFLCIFLSRSHLTRLSTSLGLDLFDQGGIKIASSIPESQSHLLFLPDEILQHVLNDVVAGIVTNKKTGYPHPYYAPNYRDKQKERRRNLVNLCLSCRKVNALATPLLYHDVFLNKLNRPEYSEEEKRNDSADEGVFTLGLFLRTMLERLKLRAHVRHLDYWFILSPALDYETDPLPRSGFNGSREFQLLKEYVSGAHSEKDSVS